MLHMIDDNLEAYRRAVRDTARAQALTDLNPGAINQEHYRNCVEEEQLRLDGLQSVIGMAIREYAAREPCNPFSINGDVNQGVLASIADAISDDPQPDWKDSLADAAEALSNEHGTFPPPPKHSP